ncbi:MAG: DMT family transporter [Arachnia sp.]
MTTAVALAVLGSALLHGTWNAIAKAIPDRLVASALIGLPNLVLGAIGCVVFPLPAAASWPWLLSSGVLQAAALILVTAAYARAEFGRAYPISRGLSIVVVAGVSVAVLGEHLSWLQTAGIATIVAALCTLALAGGGRAALHGIGLAVCVALVIAGYSLLDGVGVRISGSTLGYASWMFAVQGLLLPVVCFAFTRDRRRLLAGMREHAALGTIGGVLSVVTYGIIVWAQARAPLAMVSALRETGVVAAVLVGWLLFKESLTTISVVAASCAVAGIALLRLG